MVPEWQSWGFAAVVAVAALAGLVARGVWPDRLAALPPQHVAAAALIGAFAWEASASLPGLIQGWLLNTAGLGPPGDATGRLLVAASVGFVGASVIAIVGILRRQPWGAVLGIGVAVGRVVTTILAAISFLSVIGDSLPGGQAIWYVAQVAQGSVPAVAAAVLLAWPFRRGRSRMASVSWRAGPTSDEIVEVDPSIDFAEWPDSAQSPERGSTRG